MRTRIVALALALGALGVGACGPGVADRYGGDLFAVACSHCHGSDLGGGIGPPLGPGTDAASLTDAQISGVIRIGPGAMPGFDEKLDAAQVQSLVVYLRSRQNP